jgi:hypothetical protein
LPPGRSEKLPVKKLFFTSKSMFMSYPARQCLAKTKQAMVWELFTNVDQKARRKSIACGAKL